MKWGGEGKKVKNLEMVIISHCYILDFPRPSEFVCK